MGDFEESTQEPRTAGQVRSRAVASAAVVAARGIAVRSLGLVGNIVIARLLVPEEFGTAAFGLAFVTFAKYLSDGGLAAGLIRRERPATTDDLRSMVAVQLTLTSVIAGLVALASVPFGRVGAVTAVMVAALPVVSFRTPGVVVLERALNYRPLATAEVAETVAYNACAIATVAAGFGVWGIATAAVVRLLTGSAVVLRYGPTGALRPLFSWQRIRPLMKFGVRFQAVAMTNMVRDQGLNIGIAAVAGLGVLGVWALARRILEVPFLLFDAMLRVSFPAMSRLLASGEQARPLIERGVSVGAVATGLIVTPLVASTPALVPAVFGARWDEVVWVIPAAGLALMIGGPVSVATAGYLFAVGDASRVLKSTIAHTMAWLVVGLSLLPVLGAPALGIGWVASSLVDATVLGRGAAQRTGARLVPSLVWPLVGALAGAGGGWLIASRGETLLDVALGAGAGTAVFLLVLTAASRVQLVETVRLGRRALLDGFTRRRQRAEGEPAESGLAP
ncbi:MAG: oligosaccharide flippase family protein [Actinomycetota bacterium]